MWDRPRVSPCIVLHEEVLLVVAMWDRPRVSPCIVLHEEVLLVVAMWDRPRVSPCLLHDISRTRRMQTPQSRAKETCIEWRIELWTHSFALLVVSI